MKKKLFFAAVVLLLLACIVIAVEWYPVAFKLGWTQRTSGFCGADSQCLVATSGSPNFDNIPENYFSDDKPLCIDDTQYILDFYCDNGDWSSRTKLLAEKLLRLAEARSNNDFSLFCGDYDLALNNVNYQVNNVLVSEYLDNNCNPHNSVDDYQCINSICVLKYSDGTAFGTTLNVPLDDSKSFLKALDKSTSKCNSVKNNNNQFDSCGDNIWYNHNTESIIVLPTSASLPTTATNVNILYFVQPFNQIKSFANTITNKNLSFFDNTKIFNNLYFAKKNNKEIFSFLEKDQTEFSYDYIGIRLKDISIDNFCSDVINLADQNAFCQQSPNYVVVAEKTPDVDESIVKTWVDLTAKLRLQ